MSDLRLLSHSRVRGILAASLSTVLAGVSMGGSVDLGARRVVGRIMDEARHPLTYASISVIGSSEGTFSREGGVFFLGLPTEGAFVLKISMVGYRDTTVDISNVPQADSLQVVLRSRWSLRGNPEAAKSIVQAIQSAHLVDALLMDNRMTRSPDAPSICHYPILAVYPPPDSSALVDLCRAILDASRDSCGLGPTQCLFDPRYGFRFHDHEPPLELLVDRSCDALWFQRGDEAVAGGQGGGYTCISDAIRRTMTRVFSEDAVK